jgi:hypothetical protein
MGAEFHADRRTDMTNLIVAFRNFANAPKNSWHHSLPLALMLHTLIQAPTVDTKQSRPVSQNLIGTVDPLQILTNYLKS